MTRNLICITASKCKCNILAAAFLVAHTTYCTYIRQKLGKKTLSAHKGVIYQTKGKDLVYTFVKLVRDLFTVCNDLSLIIYLLDAAFRRKKRVTKRGVSNWHLNSYLVNPDIGFLKEDTIGSSRKIPLVLVGRYSWIAFLPKLMINSSLEEPKD